MAAFFIFGRNELEKCSSLSLLVIVTHKKSPHFYVIVGNAEGGGSGNRSRLSGSCD